MDVDVSALVHVRPFKKLHGLVYRKAEPFQPVGNLRQTELAVVVGVELPEHLLGLENKNHYLIQPLQQGSQVLAIGCAC